MRTIVIFLLALVGTFLIDQNLKEIFVAGYQKVGHYISLELHYNKGVAFSMLSFLGSYLKWLQLFFVSGIIIYLFASDMIKKYPFVLGLLVGGALGNLYDRFTREGVVDYIYWHRWFSYPVFNYADIMVFVSIVTLIWFMVIEEKRKR